MVPTTITPISRTLRTVVPVPIADHIEVTQIRRLDVVRRRTAPPGDAEAFLGSSGGLGAHELVVREPRFRPRRDLVPWWITTMTRPRTLLVLSVVASCTPAMLGQDDGFREKIPTSCTTADACEELRLEAVQRTGSCQQNTVGAIRCEDAQADLADVEQRLRSLRAKEGAEMAARRRAAAEEAENERAAANAAEQRTTWVAGAVDRCRRDLVDDGCRGRPVYVDDETQTDCFTQCRAAISRGRDVEYTRALSDCVSMIVQFGSTTPDCRLRPAEDAELQSRRVECATECKDQASKLVALATPAATTPATSPSPSRRTPPPVHATHAPDGPVDSQPAPRTAPPPSQPVGLRCCDGSLSPTCLCPGHRGCCSHHGGVCGCAN